MTLVLKFCGYGFALLIRSTTQFTACRFASASAYSDTTDWNGCLGDNMARQIESIEVFPGENGGHRVVHNFKREAGKKGGSMSGGIY